MEDAIASIETAEPKTSGRLSLICDLLDKRKGVKRLAIRDSVGSPLLTDAEATIRVLVSFNAVTSIDGTFSDEISWGQSLEPQLKAVGARGVIRAIRKLAKFMPNYDRFMSDLDKTMEDMEYDEFQRQYDELRDKRQQCEAGAEGESELDELLWKYAVRHRDQILTDWKPPKKRRPRH